MTAWSPLTSSSSNPVSRALERIKSGSRSKSGLSKARLMAMSRYWRR
jgi:hypothetical protein